MNENVNLTGALPEREAPAASAASSSEWTAGRIAAISIGSLLALIALAFLVGAGVGLWADLTQRDGDYVTTDVHNFSTSGYALATEPTKLGAAGTGWLYGPSVLGKIRIRVTPAGSSKPLFVGIGPSADVDHYLGGVDRTTIFEFFDSKSEPVTGAAPASAPGTQHFWAASVTGAGAQTLLWKPTDGSWTVVVMNADGRAGIDVGADLGARIPDLLWISVGLLAAGAVLATGGALLIVGAIRRRRASVVNTA